MDTETLNVMNEGMYLGLGLLLKIFALLFSSVAAVYLAVTLGAIAWLCYAEGHWPTRHTMPKPTEPVVAGWPVLLNTEEDAGIDAGLDDSLAVRGARRERAAIFRAQPFPPVSQTGL